MSLGSRILNRGRAALTANLASTPREPLLFLYPQWIRTSSTSTDAASSQDAVGTVRPIRQKTRRDALSPNTVSTTSYQMSPKTDETATTTIHSAQAILESTVDLTDIFPRRHSERQDPSVVERKVRKVISVAKDLENAEIADRKVRKAYQELRREQLRSWHPDWRVILTDLEDNTPQQGKWFGNALEIVVPLESLPQLLQGIDDYILDIGNRYGCSINLGSRDEDTRQYRRFIISGPPNAISKTTADILRIAPYTEMNLLPSPMTSRTDDLAVEDNPLEESAIVTIGSIENEVAVRNVIAVSAPEKLKMPPGKIPQPKKWDHVSFLDYVRSLTTSTMPNHLNRFGFGMAQNHSAAVTETLRRLFKDPDCRKSISRTACNEVMEYFVKMNRFEDVRAIFVHLDMLGLPMVPETFNIMLRGAAKSEDLHNFHFILHMMLRRGFAPNGGTWLAFISATPDIRVKLHILTAMKEKGLTSHPSILKGVCEQLVEPEICSAIEQSLSQDEFVAHMDSRYGEQWLSLDSANRILHSLGARGLISRCWEFLFLMESRFIKADNYSINTILHHCKQTTNLNGAVELLRSLPSNTRFVPDEETYRILFELAWRTRSYNLAKVVWRYACLSASTTFRMRRRVSKSLLYAMAKDLRMTPRQRWNQFAGPVIFGANSNGEHPVQLMANIEVDGDIAGSGLAIDKTDRKALGSSEWLSEVAVTEAKDAATATVNGARPEASELPTSETHSNDTECEIMGNEAAGTQALTSRIVPADLQSHDHNKDSEISLIREVPWEDFWQKVKPQVQQKLECDQEIYKEWLPVKPFSKMLVEALERDTEWRREDHYAEKNMHSLIRDAIPVLIRSKRSKRYGGIGEHEWK